MRNEIKYALQDIGSAESRVRYATRVLAEAEKEVGEKRAELERVISWDDVRPMTPGDVEVGALYVGYNDGGFYVGKIDEVYNPNFEYKGFAADDGCRYGYKDHYILK